MKLGKQFDIDIFANAVHKWPQFIEARALYFNIEMFIQHLEVCYRQCMV
jgi:hypothetical protein